MRLDHHDVVALLDRLLEKEPQSSRPDGFRIRLQRLRDLVARTDTAEHTLATISDSVFPGVSKNSLRETLRQFRTSLAQAAKAADLRIELVRGNARKGALADEIICHFEGWPLPSAKGSVTRESILNLDQTKLEPPRSLPDVIRIFVSFSTKDEKEMIELVDMLKKTWGTRRSHQIEFWIFHEPQKGGLLAGEDNVTRVRQEIATCPFGLILFSPDYTASKFIREHELSAYFPDVPGKHPVLVDLRNSGPSAPHLPLEASGKFIFSLDKQSYAEMRGKDRKERFAIALNDHIEALCRKHFSLMEPSEPLTDTPTNHEEKLECLIAGRHLDDGELITPFYDIEDERGIDTVQDLIAWAKEPRRAHYFALLGEVGAGKTTAALLFARELNAEAGQVQAYYFDMRYVNYAGLLDQTNKRPKLDQVIDAILSRHSDSKSKAADYIRAVRENHAVLIFDGLDEIFISLNDSEQDAMMNELLGALPLSNLKNDGAGKLLLAFRTHYFRSHIAERGAFTLQGREGIDEDKRSDNRASMEKARMLPFSPEQIRAYLQVNVPEVPIEQIWKRLLGIHNLLDLATRPYLLNLIRRQLPTLNAKLEQNEKVRPVDLYEGFIQDWSHERNRFHNIIAPEDKVELMELLAAFLWSDDKKVISAGDLERWLLDTLISHPRWRVLYSDYLKARQTEALLSDFRTASFIARWDGDLFRFAHTSMQEYFFACRLVKALAGGDVATTWDVPIPSKETFDFAGQLIESLHPSDRSRAMIGWRSLLENVEQPFRSRHSALAFLAHSTGQAFPVPESIKLQAQNLDLTALKFTGTAKKPLGLQQANFSGASLIRSQFHHVELGGSNWHGANLCSAEFLDCGLEDADFTSAEKEKTDLEGVRMRECRLNDARITGATLDGLQIEHPHWDGMTELHWRAELADYHSLLEESIPGQWTAPLRTGSTSPLPPTEDLPSPPSAQWSSGHRGAVSCVAYFPDGRRIVSGGDSSIRIWDVDSGQCLHILEGHTEEVSKLAVSQDGRLIASAAHDGLVRVWDGENGTFLRTLQGQSGYAMSVAFSSNGHHIFSGTSNYCVGIWDAYSGECLETLEIKRLGSSFFGHNLAIASDDRLIAASVDIKSIIVLGENVGELFLKGHAGQIGCMAFSPDSRRLVSGAYDNAVRVWDVESGECLFVLEGHSKHIQSVCYSPDGHQILSGSGDNTLRVWDAKTGMCLHVLQGISDSVCSAEFSPDGNRIVVGSGMSVQIWDFEAKILIREIKGRHNWISCTAFSDDGLKIATGCHFDWIAIWDITTGKRIQRLTGHTKQVMSIAFSPDDRQIASGTGTGVIRICTVADGKPVLNIGAHSKSVWALAFSPDGSRLASASTDKTVKIWEIETGALIHAVEGNSEMVTKLVFSDDGRWLLGCQQNGNDPRKRRSVCVWDSITGILQRTFPGQRNSADCVAISPDNRYIVSSSLNDPICLWTFDNEECLFTIKEQTCRVTNLAFSPDGSRILTKSSDNIVRGWDSRNGTPRPVSEADELYLLKGSCQTGFNLSLSPVGTVRVKRVDGTEVDIDQERSDDYAVLEKAPGENNWWLARAKGEYWRYVNYATDGPEGRVLWSADLLGPVPEE